LNDGAARLFGRAAADVLGQPLSALLPEASEDEHAERFAQLLAASPAAPFETVFDRGAGEKRHVAAAATPLVDAGGTALGWVVVVRDVTPLKQAERRLAQAMREAKFANRSKSEFLANMSHELRTPLNAIIGFSSVMRDELFGPLGQSKYRGYANDIHEAGSHLLAIINDLLDVSAIEAEKLELNETTFPLRRPLDSAVRLVSPRLEACKVELRRALADDLPALRADERRFKQVLLNLLTNAIKFTPAGGRVLVSAQIDAAGNLELIVSDTGIGMDAGGIAKALERFGQVDGGLDRRREGTGLGLPLTLGLVELHGGALRIDSEPGTGTTVTVTLPAERLVQEERPALRLVQAG
jgi:PAS domain S-box-containing protein